MELKTCYFLVCVAVACVPGLAQEGGIYVEPKQGGIYVEPKQSCGGTMTVDEEGEEITSPNYPANYGNRESCTWNIKAENPSATVEMECSVFNVRCNGDRMVILEDGTVMDRICGRGSKSYYSLGNSLTIRFRTNKQGTRKGFSCRVRSSSSSTTDLSTNTEETTSSPGNTGSCQCGVANTDRIVGGQVVSPKNKYPWHVGIKFSNGRNYWCGGSIINDRYVMTAAHCIDDLNGNAQGLVVGVADHNMFSTTDDVSGVTRLVNVEQIIGHPDYNDRTLNNDIALLRLSETLDLSQHKQLRAVCLPADDSKNYAGMMAIASGWGTLSSGGSQPSRLNEVTVPILEQSCFGISGVTANMLCAGLREGGKDTCQGDSGGPLYVEESSKYTQVGITSWGRGCAAAGNPGVYARVSKYVSWIRRNTDDATYCQ